MIRIKTGKIVKPVKLVIYGSEGIGKTTLASKAPDPLFIDTEDGTGFIDCKRLDPSPANWKQLIDALNEIAYAEGLCQTVVVDTADWAEKLAVEEVIRYCKVKSIEDIPYGKGYTMVQETFRELLGALDDCVAHGKHVIVTAHAKMSKVELPDERGAYDHWGLKLTRQTAPILKEWADALLFANYKTFVETDAQGHGKASGGARMIYTAHTPYWDAKNRHGLAESLRMEWESIAGLFALTNDVKPAPAREPSALLIEVAERMKADVISDGDIMRIASKKKMEDSATPVAAYSDGTLGWLIDNWDKVVKYIKSEKEKNNG